MQSIAWSLLMLLLVLALIPASLWALKRVQSVRPGGAARQLELLAQLQLGPRERVLLVRVQERVLVLGATGQQISLLGEASAPAPADAGPPVAADGFAALLKNLGAGLQQRGRP
jgi:flagellar protein FliO/FliZ